MTEIPWYAVIPPDQPFPSTVTTDPRRIRRILEHAPEGTVCLVALCRPGECPPPVRRDGSAWQLWTVQDAHGHSLPEFQPATLCVTRPATVDRRPGEC